MFYFSLFSTLLTLPFSWSAPCSDGASAADAAAVWMQRLRGAVWHHSGYLWPGQGDSVYDYSQILFAAGRHLFFRQIPDGWSMVYILICGAGVGMFLYNKRRDAALNGK